VFVACGIEGGFARTAGLEDAVDFADDATVEVEAAADFPLCECFALADDFLAI
jgi:hypothetical protein